MVTLQQYINESPRELKDVQIYPGGMNIQLYHCGLIKFCNESGIQTVERLISNVDIDEITDFPHWSSALDFSTYDKILTNAYEYIRPELKSNVRCVPINWGRVAANLFKIIDGDTVTERQALFALFALPAIKRLDEVHPVRVSWEQKLEEIWANYEPKLPSSTRAPINYTPDKSKYNLDTPSAKPLYYKGMLELR